MLIELPMIWIVALNLMLWPVIQLGLAWGFTRMPTLWFRPPQRPLPGETVEFYEKRLQIRRWKDRLPDGAAWLGGGFPKAKLAKRDAAYLARFAAETWRGECCHLAAIASTPVFFLWNPPWADGIMLVYALLANLPCIFAQRYNRMRLAGSLHAHRRSRSGQGRS